MKNLSAIEYDILGALYFVEPFDNIVKEVNAPENIITDCLRGLIQHKLVTAMKFDPEQSEYVRSFIYDSDNMRAYHYLVTKEGLMRHNSK